MGLDAMILVFWMFLFFLKIYLFIYLAVPGHMGSKSLSRDQTQAPCIKTTES